MTTPLVPSITDEQIAEIEEFCDGDWSADFEEVRGIKAGVLRALISRLRAAERDAERYRWLRNDALKMEVTAPAIMVVDMVGHPVYRGAPWNSLLCDDDADSAIDAAMQEHSQ